MRKIVIADSSFYICFLEDINKPSFICSLFSHSFKFYISTIIHDEISKSGNFRHIKDGLNIQTNLDYKIDEILKPFFGKNEVRRGEHEAIALAFLYYEHKVDFNIIFDDMEVRKFIQKNIPKLEISMIGTLGFIARCKCKYDILSESVAVCTINNIKNSKFRASDNLIKSILQQIKECHND